MVLEQDFILLILNCTKYHDKALQQKNGWLKTIPTNLIYYHVLGNEHLETDFHFDNDERILWVKTKDDYNSLPDKVISAYSAVNSTFQFKYIFKTDDDQTLLKPNFFTTLINILLNRENHYGGYIVDIKREHISRYYLIHPELPNNLIMQAIQYCNGRFYFLSQEAAKNLIGKREQISKEFLEDYAIGLYLDTKYKQNMLPIQTAQVFSDSVYASLSVETAPK